VQDSLSYSTRPLWDKAQGPQNLISHLHAPGVPADNVAACQLHGWEPTVSSSTLWDATLISTELDMLEIRLRELWNVVDKFLLLESTHTMSGSAKVSERVVWRLFKTKKANDDNIRTCHFSRINLVFRTGVPKSCTRRTKEGQRISQMAYLPLPMSRDKL